MVINVLWIVHVKFLLTHRRRAESYRTATARPRSRSVRSAAIRRRRVFSPVSFQFSTLRARLCLPTRFPASNEPLLLTWRDAHLGAEQAMVFAVEGLIQLRDGVVISQQGGIASTNGPWWNYARTLYEAACSAGGVSTKEFNLRLFPFKSV